MKRFLYVCIWLFSASSALAEDGAKGAFETFVRGRPLMPWETLKGYRLFFHPEDPEPMRRTLTIAIPTDRKIVNAYSLVRPLEPNPNFKDAWLRIEGEVKEERVQFSWDGMYRGADFPDKKYFYEVHVLWSDGDKLDQTVVVLKSLDHPRLSKVGDQNLEAHELEFKKGEFEAVKVAATVSLREMPHVPVIAKVLAPNLEAAFQSEGIQLSYKYLEDDDGNPSLRESVWHCACQQGLDLDSPAREKAKKVLCDWDLTGLVPGVYELRLSLYHKMKHPGQFDPCDTPILDEDRIRVMVRP